MDGIPVVSGGGGDLGETNTVVLVGAIATAGGVILGALGKLLVDVINARGKNSLDHNKALFEQQKAINEALRTDLDECKRELKEHKADLEGVHAKYRECRDEHEESMRLHRRALGRIDELREVLRRNNIPVREWDPSGDTDTHHTPLGQEERRKEDDPSYRGPKRRKGDGK